MSSTTRRTLVGVAALALVAGTASVALAVSGGRADSADAAATATATTSAPPTQPDTGIAVATPSAPSAQPIEPGPGDAVATDPTTSFVAGAPVQVAITSAEQVADTVEVYGFVPGLIEDGGTCTATFTQSGATAVVATSSAFADATTTVCEPVEVEAAQLGAGTWAVVLGYSSPAHAGTSQPGTLEVSR